ncbi:RNA polymerase RpoN-/SigL-like sigma 54 subunit [Ciceribacter lividus]|uniref:RNA polymerase sigma-54 factor n=1 Tax=Ciceribacter lividus TaxID=1197950 RepID=A0A6I7HNG8_9HYPH|nr:RNA polymerase factor sigma-54 [Ciceribacter lividus]RCW27054.1 RNA polymerase RpoN-/SigL-like sigma 54 subunit [Ciceribacter lividus]
MALSANLYLRQSQSLVMTPQLMQSIQLLQMTHVELVQFIAQEVEKNPLLDFAPEDNDGGSEPMRGEEAVASSETAIAEESSGPASDWYENGKGQSLNDSLDTNFDTALADEGVGARADAPELLGQWKSMPGAGTDFGEGYDLDDFVAGQVTLRDHLSQQIPFAFPDSADRMVALTLMDQLDEAGYLRADLGEVAERFGGTPERVEHVIGVLQTLDPPGIFARSLSECLAIQLRQRDRLDPAMATLVDNLELLAKRDFATLKKLCGVDEEDLIDMLSEIRGLNPKPASGFETSASEPVVPDIIVRPASDGGWAVELNPDVLPRVLVNQSYYAKVSKCRDAKDGDQAFLAECLQNANWLTRSLDQRARTILKVASEIIRQQDAFLRHGVDHLRPLNLRTVADAIKMHESTVSRVTSNKYMLTPRGLFELKYFFTVSIASAEGGDSHSAEAVRHRIRTLITQENPEAVLSDDDIVSALKDSGIDLARRTVAKYREAMNIPSSVQRRREKRALAKVSTS